MGVEVEKFKQGSKETKKIVNDNSNKHQKVMMTHSLRLPFDLDHFCMGEEIVYIQTVCEAVWHHLVFV